MQTDKIMDGTRAEQVDAQTWRVEVNWPNANGLHGREAATLLKLGRIHKATLVLECSGQKADVESLMGLLSIEASCDAPLTATATGPEAENLIRAIEKCFQDGFESMSGSMGKTCFRKKFERHFHLPQ
jgi:phosphotransferase system HPr (HPr) family protein